MPPIIHDYAEIKRRMDEIQNGPKPAPVYGQSPLQQIVREMEALQRAYATGGVIPAPSRPYIVGERAPESFVPNVGTYCEVGGRVYRVKRVDGDKITLWPPLHDSALSPEGQDFIKKNRGETW